MHEELDVVGAADGGELGDQLVTDPLHDVEVSPVRILEVATHVPMLGIVCTAVAPLWQCDRDPRIRPLG